MPKLPICSGFVLLVVLLAASLHAQTPGPNLRFEVASVKVSAPLTVLNNGTIRASFGFHGGPGTDQPDLLTIGHTTLRNLLLRAFSVRIIQVSGPGSLTDSPESFDISAKVPAGASKDDVNVMLQNLLADRFGLVVHRETTDLAGYELVVGKNGSKMPESNTQPPPPPPPADTGPIQTLQAVKLVNDKNGVPQLPAGNTGILNGFDGNKQFLSGRAQTMAQLATALESTLSKPIVDRTGLTGKYDFGLAFDGSDLPGGFRPSAAMTQGANAANGPVAAQEPAPHIFTAVQQDLGLRLDQKKVPVDLIVIDKLQKAPTEN